MPTRTAPAVCVFVALAACERPDGRHAELDTPPAPFVALGPATPLDQLPKITDKAAPAKKEAPKDPCGRDKGRTPDNQCVTLKVRDLPDVQRVQIPAGTFVMGALPGDYNGLLAREVAMIRWSGQPPRQATLPSFFIDLHEVTRAAYAKCVAAGACSPAVCPPGQEDPAAKTTPELAGALPQTCVTHAQAAGYCAHTGARLPSEAEWEFAARGPDARIYPWGNDIEDQIPNAIYPAGHVREDLSYFGILGLGSNVFEWVQEVYDADAGLRPFLAGEFRDPQGPANVARMRFEYKIVCNQEPGPGCEGPTEPPMRHVIKHANAGKRTAGRDSVPPHHPGFELEGWLTPGVGPKVGFRCAADLAPDDVVLTLPASPATVPLYRVQGDLQIFGGVAEAVSQVEARRFCENLRVPDGTGQTLAGWRLPLQEEMPALAPSFRGPGPFWAEDGAVAQHSKVTPVPQETPWVMHVATPETALLARCVRAG
jgi:hypothetical protein